MRRYLPRGKSCYSNMPLNRSDESEATMTPIELPLATQKQSLDYIAKNALHCTRICVHKQKQKSHLCGHENVML